MKNLAKIAVYGSGVSGLIASYYLVNKGFHVDIIDPYQEPKIKSIKTPDGLVEQAANSILMNAEVKKLLEHINIDHHHYYDVGKKKYVFLEGTAKRWPLSFLESIKAAPKLYGLFKGKDNYKPHKNETVQKWGERALTSPVLENLLLPALQGVYGAQTRELSAGLVFGKYFEPKKKSDVKYSKGSVSFPGGMQNFSEALKRMLIDNGSNFLLEADGEYDHHVVSTPSFSLPDMVSKENKEILKNIEYNKVSTLTVFIEDSDRMPFEGFGCVFKEQPSGLLGLILNSDLFDGRASEGLVSETWILDGRRVQEEAGAIEVVKSIRKNDFSRKNMFRSSAFKYWERAFPIYNLELEKALLSLKDQENLSFFANWTGALGIGSMIEKGEAFSDSVLKKLKDKKT